MQMEQALSLPNEACGKTFDEHRWLYHRVHFLVYLPRIDGFLQTILYNIPGKIKSPRGVFFLQVYTILCLSINRNFGLQRYSVQSI